MSQVTTKAPMQLGSTILFTTPLNTQPTNPYTYLHLVEPATTSDGAYVPAQSITLFLQARQAQELAAYFAELAMRLGRVLP